MIQLSRQNSASVKKYPERILQFGAGNFLRGFVNWIVEVLNNETTFNANVIVIKPTKGRDYIDLKAQDGLFHLCQEGYKKGKVTSESVLISNISTIINPYIEWKLYMETAKISELRFIISNTTEAGIQRNDNDSFTDQPAVEFPAKLTQWLFARYSFFQGDLTKGCILLPCELIDNNGEALRNCIHYYIELWKLGSDFSQWIDTANYFCNTLVDRIVSGFSGDKAQTIENDTGLTDKLQVSSEIYHSWIIDGPEFIQKELPVSKTDLNIRFVNDLTPFKKIKVRILNGAHTSLVPVAFLYGMDTVRESVENGYIDDFLRHIIFHEICPTLDFDKSELEQFSNDALERFKNPFIEHALMSISLNSIAKFKTRLVPTIIDFSLREKKLPKHILFSLASLIIFYKGMRNGETIDLKDDTSVLDFFQRQWELIDGSDESMAQLVVAVLSNHSFWDQDLSIIPDLNFEVTKNIIMITRKGMKNALESLLTINR